MKINKILAAGIAATLAVTSLSAVVSAEVQTKTFEVYRTKAEFSGVSVKFNADVNKAIAQKLRQATTGKIVLTEIADYVKTTIGYNGFLAYLAANDEDDLLAYYASAEGKAALDSGNHIKIDGISITATGYQHVGDTATVTKTFTFVNQDANWNTIPWTLTVLDDKTPIYHDGEFASYFFNEITSLQLEVKLKGSTLIEDEYNYWMATSDDGGINWGKQLQIGNIAVYAKQADGVAAYDYGTHSHGDELAEVLGVQATEILKSVPSAPKGAALTAADIGTGVILGSKALNTDVGSPLKSNQKVATVDSMTDDAVKIYTVPFAGAYDAGLLAAINATTAVTETQPIVWNGEVKTSGKLYDLDYDGGNVYFYSTATYADVDAFKAAVTELTASNALTTETATGAAIAFVEEESVSDHVSIVPAEATDPNGANTDPVEDGVILIDANGKLSYQVNVWGNAWTAMDLSDTISTAHLLAYAFADGGWFESKQIYGDGNPWLLGGTGIISGISATTSKQNGWMPKTTYDASKKIKNLIDRKDVKLLSKTNEYYSAGQTYGDNKTADTNQDNDDNQTYTATFWDGTNPYGFAGLASQVADFFNKQDNGTITFTFAADAGDTAGKWTDGVPSTEVGLKGFSSEYLNDFALFFNYSNTTGTMLSAVKLDKTAGTVTFDIADFLKDCGGLTKATLENIYYGLDNGVRYSASVNKYGLWVSKVELAYDDAGVAVDANTDDDADDDAAVVVADDDDDADDDVIADDDDDIAEDDDIIEDDDDDDDDAGEIIEDDDDDDDDVNNDVDYVDADDDANPGTGVGLAVIPAIVAGAALVVSKKRK